MLNGVSLAVLALLGLANGLHTDSGVAVWRVILYPVLALLVYLHGRLLDVRAGGWTLIAVAATAVPCGLAVSTEPYPQALWEAVGGLLSLAIVVVLPWLAGHSRRQQAALVRAGQREVEQLKREREYVGEQARSGERARIATDVHDALGHELALIALRAGALELSADLTQANRRAATQLRASAVKATDRLRETIGMLRQDVAPVAPPDETLTALVERAAAAGMDVTLIDEANLLARPYVAGADSGAYVVDRAVHRVVREALTNAARHAPDAAVTVRLDRTDSALTVTVANATTENAPARLGTGSGLAGLAERVRLLGGDFTAGPGADGFVVTATLPMSPRPRR